MEEIQVEGYVPLSQRISRKRKIHEISGAPTPRITINDDDYKIRFIDYKPNENYCLSLQSVVFLTEKDLRDCFNMCDFYVSTIYIYIKLENSMLYYYYYLSI
jgi:hypothetical protein